MIPEDLSDRERLIDRATAGDAEASAYLLLQVEADLRRQLARGVDRNEAPWQTVSDLAQSVMRRAYSALLDGQVEAKSPAEFRAWLGRLADNRLRDLIRHRRAARRDGRRTHSLGGPTSGEPDAPSFDPPAAAADPAERLEREEEEHSAASLAARAVASLDAKDHLLLTLTMEGAGISGLCQALDLDPEDKTQNDRVRKALERARVRLKLALARERQAPESP